VVVVIDFESICGDNSLLFFISVIVQRRRFGYGVYMCVFCVCFDVFGSHAVIDR